MGNNLNITLTTPAIASVSIQPQTSAVSSLQIGPQLEASIASLGDVSVSNPQNGDVLQYSASQGQYVVASLTVQGGTF